jgi:hypothetical protein
LYTLSAASALLNPTAREMITTATAKENIKNFFMLSYLLSVVGGLFLIE